MASQHRTKRRSFLKYAGAAGVTGLAGCTGNGGGNGGNGGDDTPAGDDTDGTTTGTASGSLTSVSLNIPAYGYWTVVAKEMERRGTLEQNFEEAGYDPEINYSWGGATLFASGKMDIVHISPLELARLGPERDMNTACVGRVCGEFEGFWTRPGTAYDPDEAGSIEAAVENIIQDNAQLAHGSWAGGNIPPSKIFMDEYGYEYVEGGDFKIATANYTTIPRLLVEEGELDAALTSPMHGGGRYAMDQEMVPIAQYPPWFQDNYDFVPPLVNVACTSDFLDENEDAARAMVQTWDTGMDWLYEQGTDAIQTEDHASQLGCKTMEGAKYVIDYGLGNDVPFAMDQEFLFQNSFLTDDYIQGQEQFLSTVGERGLVGSNWEDYVEFAKLE